MKKTVFLLAIALLPLAGFSQFKLGIKIDPNISLSRLAYTAETKSFSDLTGSGKAKAKLNLGIFADIPIMNHIDFNVGLGWGNNNIGFELNYVADDTTTNAFSTQNMQFALQYLNLPVSLKLYTNDISSTMKIYVNVGTKLGFRLDEKQQEELNDYQAALVGDKVFTKWFDSSLIMGAGVEMKVGSSNIAFAGLEYERGLANVVGKEYLEIDGASIDKSTLEAFNDQIKLVLGFKF